MRRTLELYGWLHDRSMSNVTIPIDFKGTFSIVNASIILISLWKMWHTDYYFCVFALKNKPLSLNNIRKVVKKENKTTAFMSKIQSSIKFLFSQLVVYSLNNNTKH